MNYVGELLVRSCHRSENRWDILEVVRHLSGLMDKDLCPCRFIIFPFFICRILRRDESILKEVWVFELIAA
jgi:hypothetical protein